MDLFRGMRSETPERDRRRADAAAGEREQARGKQRENHSLAVARAFALEEGGRIQPKGDNRAATKPIAKEKETTAPATMAPAKVPAERPPPKLRQLAFKNGWAEYVEEGTGQHVYKNVFTNEMTKTKPAEYASTITDSQNQRRLAWLSSHRQMAMMGDMALMGHMPNMGPQ